MSESMDPSRKLLARRMEAMVSRMSSVAELAPAQRCVDNIERVVRSRDGRVSRVQADMLRSCLRMPGVTCSLPGYRQPDGDGVL